MNGGGEAGEIRRLSVYSRRVGLGRGLILCFCSRWEGRLSRGVIQHGAFASGCCSRHVVQTPLGDSEVSVEHSLLTGVGQTGVFTHKLPSIMG